MILLGVGAVLAWLWGVSDLPRGYLVVGSFATSAVGLMLVGGWTWFFSGFSRRARSLIVGLPAMVIVVFAATRRIDTMDGDMMPSFTWRWSPKLHQSLNAEARGVDQTPIQLDTASTDFPQFLGANRDGVVTGVKLSSDWKSRPPRLLWKREIGGGWSSFSVTGDYAFTQELRAGREFVSCYEVKTGKVVWMQPDGDATENKDASKSAHVFLSVVGGDGPRSTPTISGDRVFSMGSTGRLTCFDAATGERLWVHNVLAEHGADIPKWGKCCSPLIVDQLVVVTGGGVAGPSLLAYDIETGKLAWTAGKEGPCTDCYASPALVTLAGVRQILVLNDVEIAGHDPESGRPLWSLPWPWKNAKHPKASQPVLLADDRILITAEYGSGTALVEVRRDAQGRFHAEEGRLWKKNRNLRTKLTNAVRQGDYAYGLSSRILTCLDLNTGKRAWKKGRYGHGQVLLVEDLLLIQAETGEVALVEADPEQYREVARFQALENKTWNYPTLAGKHLLVRNDREAACYELPLEPGS